ncbi:MarR family winged helix-turn-helix transcriptional regulator [Paractinoplanes abujensis]|uniref:DNA-binding MarR family transcriptional regulator n=1 Tax=Paractinoplanes abujensis TaxID=882441 RepID=A0A7W7CR68_9ACTN|nr:MarR family transcriptional regulator [Actinoplanes abujensis]MBB4693226.1 DNA-binding MarR family transcriptional regulator [Actinoplanes abujensis]
MTERRDDDPGRAAAWQDLVLAAHLLEAALERQSQRDGTISHGHFKVLLLLNAAEDRTLGLKTLAGTLRFSPSRVSHTLTVLERQGLVTRGRVPEGRRAYEATLTPSGRRLVARVLRGQREEIRDAIFDNLGPSGTATLGALSARVIKVLDEMTG